MHRWLLLIILLAGSSCDSSEVPPVTSEPPIAEDPTSGDPVSENPAPLTITTFPASDTTAYLPSDMYVGGKPLSLRLTDFFEPAVGVGIEFKATASPASVLSAELIGIELRLMPHSLGEATVEVEASLRDTVRQVVRFRVTVEDPCELAMPAGHVSYFPQLTQGSELVFDLQTRVVFGSGRALREDGELRWTVTTVFCNRQKWVSYRVSERFEGAYARVQADGTVYESDTTYFQEGNIVVNPEHIVRIGPFEGERLVDWVHPVDAPDQVWRAFGSQGTNYCVGLAKQEGIIHMSSVRGTGTPVERSITLQRRAAGADAASSAACTFPSVR